MQQQPAHEPKIMTCLVRWPAGQLIESKNKLGVISGNRLDTVVGPDNDDKDLHSNSTSRDTFR